MNQPAAQKTSGLAITSLVLGIISLCCPIFLLPLAAVICGHVARGQIKKAQDTVGGAGVAMAGLILGYLSLALSIVGAIFWFTFGSTVIGAGIDAAYAQRLHMAMETMVSDGETKSDKSLGWPADAGITTVTELKKRLVDNGYLTSEEVAGINFDKFDIGNVSTEDPENTVFIKLRKPIMGTTIYFSKSGMQESVPAPGDTTDADPKRTPAYLAP